MDGCVPCSSLRNSQFSQLIIPNFILKKAVMMGVHEYVLSSVLTSPLVSKGNLLKMLNVMSELRLSSVGETF